MDGDALVLYVRRAYRNSRVKTPKTRASLRAVPLQANALAALDQLPSRATGPPGMTEPLPFGVYCWVVEQGRVAVGDEVAVAGK